jgi:thiosulfate dehydrogenase
MIRRTEQLALLAAGVLAACTAAAGGPDSAAVRQAGSAGWDSTTWQAPSVAEIPDDSLGASIRRGLAILTNTRDSLRAYVGGNLSCTSCHLDEGRRPTAAPLTGVFARFPKYIDRSNAVIPLEDRVNYCFTRSLAGTRVPTDSREMQDIMAYLAFISRGVPVGAQTAAQGMPKMPALRGDSARGRAIFAQECARCHGLGGAGIPALRAPALWGPESFSIGASMARQERAASFIRHNMPFDRPGTLTDQQAFDVAAYVVAQPRPDSPEKENDWPTGGAPDDTPYATKGHAAYQPPPLLPRRSPRGTVVPVPHRVGGRR